MIATDIETQQTIAKNLDFCSELAEEAARMRAEEIAALQHKHDMLKGELKKFQDVNFTQEYFQELLNWGRSQSPWSTDCHSLLNVLVTLDWHVDRAQF